MTALSDDTVPAARIHALCGYLKLAPFMAHADQLRAELVSALYDLDGLHPIHSDVVALGDVVVLRALRDLVGEAGLAQIGPAGPLWLVRLGDVPPPDRPEVIDLTLPATLSVCHPTDLMVRVARLAREACALEDAALLAHLRTRLSPHTDIAILDTALLDLDLITRDVPDRLRLVAEALARLPADTVQDYGLDALEADLPRGVALALLAGADPSAMAARSHGRPAHDHTWIARFQRRAWSGHATLDVRARLPDPETLAHTTRPEICRILTGSSHPNATAA